MLLAKIAYPQNQQDPDNIPSKLSKQPACIKCKKSFLRHHGDRNSTFAHAKKHKL